MRLWMAPVIVAATIAVSLSSPGSAHACSCAYGPDDPRIFEQIAHADAVFTGTATEQNTGDTTAIYEFSVREVFAGDVGMTTEVSTSTQSAACGTRYELGTEYMVFARIDDAHRAPWSDESCSATTVASDIRTRDAAVDIFGPPSAPSSDGLLPREDDRGLQWWWAAGLGTTVLLLAVAAGFLHNRRAQKTGRRQTYDP